MNDYRMTDSDIAELWPNERLEIASRIARGRDVLSMALSILEQNSERHTAERVREVVRAMDRGILRLWCEHGNWTSYYLNGIREYDCHDCGRTISADEAGDLRNAQ